MGRRRRPSGGASCRSLRFCIRAGPDKDRRLVLEPLLFDDSVPPPTVLTSRPFLPASDHVGRAAAGSLGMPGALELFVEILQGHTSVLRHDGDGLLERLDQRTGRLHRAGQAVVIRNTHPKRTVTGFDGEPNRLFTMLPDTELCEPDNGGV